MKHPSQYKNEKVIILGLARSGVSVAKLFHKLGANVTVNDRKPREQSPEAAQLEQLGIEVICGYHPENLVDKTTALLIKNPGIPYHVSPIIDAQTNNVEVVTEVEIAYWISKAPIIGITGSNGKTTTTTLIGELLTSADLNPVVGGNIGLPLCEIASEVSSENWIVAELSSFQLKGTIAFAPKIALILNLAETHLDYHGDMQDYVASKAKILSNQTDDDIAILNWDDKITRQLMPQCKGQLFPFSLFEKLERGVFIDPPFAPIIAGDPLPNAAEEASIRSIVYRMNNDSEQQVLMPLSSLGIPGRHNAANAIAAIAACLIAGADPAKLVEPLTSFRGVEHRLEFVRTNEGVNYYNDSKATNSTATTMTIRSLSAPLVLIAGGLDRGSDYMELLPIFTDRLKGIVAVGETRHKLEHIAKLAGLDQIKIVEPKASAEETLDEAVKLASELAESGDIVLLSPACASWDMFSSYEQRGSMFKKSVHTL
ncbi:UDP-N-acetylmuramoyl-L-alanine--D-glutamate ligase [Paenibacillus endoradicis]|uniref:UDP-N-acetylmuramoyl-L-alanine--D-glutamate ligase n=1 Tax=Paenibacillus endoradicis TaxID=2972487 RepID=UPI002158A8CB|nr:UDP-N-acetylmuramoyl-L-alanine--D-glutamate ligase [Paenibacillus endoradicis]MCR8656000.1 UDP-N-acetylmuramoyl-L-alanine--D-glutamate ligase [Paenibacillus endoradicis]MCR8658326.1 UDP-N-acetylmuramoyl-L-alanine--D-glutamate ligase [Paenibacillus endoradicis]